LGDSTQPGSYGGKFWGAVRGRDDGVLLALLRDRVTRRQLLAGCTHLFWDPRFPDIKVGCGLMG
jgi:CCR4-NOT transcription complex subunit 6